MRCLLLGSNLVETDNHVAHAMIVKKTQLSSLEKAAHKFIDLNKDSAQAYPSSRTVKWVS